MKQIMLSKQKVEYLFHHVLGGFEGSHQGIQNLKGSGLADDDEYTELLEKNAQRLIERIKEFRAVEKLLCIVFACMFLWLQVSNNDLDMRKGRRARSGKRKGETELIGTL